MYTSSLLSWLGGMERLDKYRQAILEVLAEHHTALCAFIEKWY